MGGDGGVVAVKRQFLPGGGAKDPNAPQGEGKQSVKQTQLSRSKCCSLSQTELEEPVVACEMGNLYNKEALLGAFLDKQMPSDLSHIRNMKDVKEAKFHVSPSGARSCPLTGLDFNGVIPFVVVWKTGYVLSEKAVKEMGISSLQGDYGPFTSNDLVKLLPLESDIGEIQESMKTRRDLSAASCKKKKKNRAGEEEQQTSKKRKMWGQATIGVTSLTKEVIATLSNRDGEVYKSLFHNK